MLCRSSFLSENMESYSGSRRAPAYHSERVYGDRTADILLRTSGSFVTSSFGPIRTMEPIAVNTQNHFPLWRYIYSTDHISRMLPPCPDGSGPPGISSAAIQPWTSRRVEVPGCGADASTCQPCRRPNTQPEASAGPRARRV